MWWEDRSEIGRTPFGLSDVREARSYFYSKFRRLAPKWLENPLTGKRKNHFTETWLEKGLYSLAFMTYLTKLFAFLESSTDQDGRERLQLKLRSLPALEEDQLQSLFTELFVAAQFATQFTPVRIEPIIGTGNRRADFSLECGGQEIVVDVTRSSIKALSDVTMIRDQIAERATTMCQRKMIRRQARIRFSFLPKAAEKDLIVREVSDIFSEALTSPDLQRSCELSSGKKIEVEVADLPIVYDDDPGAGQSTGDWRVTFRVDRRLRGKVQIGGAFILAASVDKGVVIDVLESSFEQKIDSVLKEKMRQRRRGKPFIVVIDLSQVEALGTRPNDEACEQLLDRQLHSHRHLSAVCLFTRGEPWLLGKGPHHIYLSTKANAGSGVKLPEDFLRQWAEGADRVSGLELLDSGSTTSS